MLWKKIQTPHHVQHNSEIAKDIDEVDSGSDVFNQSQSQCITNSKRG